MTSAFFGDRFFQRLVRGAAIVGLAFALAAACSPSNARADESGFKPIFNGTNLDGWEGDPKLWSVRDGAIVGRTTPDNPLKGNTFLIWRQGPVDDFVLRFSYKIIGGNSGVQYRSKEVEKWVVAGYQADFEAGKKYSGILYEEKGRGILADRGQKVVIDENGKKHATQIADSDQLQAAIKSEDWNEFEISAQGNHLVHKINGHVTAECIDNQVAKRAMSGILALQLHAGKPMAVHFKDIRLKRTRLAANRKKIVMIAGTPSHGIGEHEFSAGTLLLQKCLDKLPQVQTAVYRNGWPADPTALDGADTVMLYMNGGAAHPLIARQRLAEIDRLTQRGVGLCFVHYAVEVPREKGGPDVLRWIGGYYESGYSINPTWLAEFQRLPQHPVTRGVEPFSLNDEWYYNIRFAADQNAATPILAAVPPESTRGTPAAKSHAGRSEVVAWALERPDGGRGFGFTGGHFHTNWGNPNFRKLVLNALLWTANADVPPRGIECAVSPDELKLNLDKKIRRR